MSEVKFTTYHVRTLSTWVELVPPQEPGMPGTGLFLEVHHAQRQDGSWPEPCVQCDLKTGLTLAQLATLQSAAVAAVEAFRRKYELP